MTSDTHRKKMIAISPATHRKIKIMALRKNVTMDRLVFLMYENYQKIANKQIEDAQQVVDRLFQ